MVIQLYGGNDGLNTVIPLDQYDVLGVKRPNVLIPEGLVLPLDLVGATGLHPAMDGMRELWEQGKLGIVQGVSYPTPNYSHFRATDIYEDSQRSRLGTSCAVMSVVFGSATYNS